MRDWLNRLQFVIAVLGLSWLGMMATHEFGHVAAAKLTGGSVVRVVLHPATISRTDVSPNPSPLVVASAGPVLGCLIPALLILAVRWLTTVSAREATVQQRVSKGELPANEPADQSQSAARATCDIRHSHHSMRISLLQFFAGFCCLTNGAYLGVGVFDRVGDADEILKAGTPPWMLILFGLIASLSGMATWHRLGSPLALLRGQNKLDPWLVRGLVATLVLVIVVECFVFPV